MGFVAWRDGPCELTGPARASPGPDDQAVRILKLRATPATARPKATPQRTH